MTWWYWALMDKMIAEPQKNLKEFAAEFRVTPACIYMVAGSDLFKMNLEIRRRELKNRIDEGISQSLAAVALKSIGVVQEIIETKGQGIGLQSAVDVMDKTLGRLGYGPRSGSPAVAVQVNAPSQVVIPVSAQDLEEARQALRRSEEAKRLEELPMKVVGPGEILPPSSEGS